MWLFTLLLNCFVAYLYAGCRQYFAKDCQDLKYIGFTESGIYRVIPDGTEEGFDVYCDMEVEGGGWLVFQRRFDGSTEFNRTWEEYQSGFGNLSGEFWLGNLALYTILRQGHYELRSELGFQIEDIVLKYIQFKLGEPADLYRLTLAPYSEETGDCDGSNNALPFSTDDTGIVDYSGGWWKHPCTNNSYNAHYWVNDTSKVGIKFQAEDQKVYFIKRTELKIRKVFG